MNSIPQPGRLYTQPPLTPLPHVVCCAVLSSHGGFGGGFPGMGMGGYGGGYGMGPGMGYYPGCCCTIM